MKKNIAIVAGGNSGEYKISLKSANCIKKNIDTNKFNIYTIFIRWNKWVLKTDDNNEIPVDKNDFSVFINNKRIFFDCIFMAIHGTPGEDGKLQGYFDLLKIPYTSCNLTTSALTFNKYFCNRIVNTFGILTAKSILLYKNDIIKESDIISKISLPCFVKPNNGGSSIGTSKVKKAEDLKKAIELAFSEDEEVLIEEFIRGREITCGIIKANGITTIFPLTEIKSKNDFFDYKAKYTIGMADEITPASVPETVEIECKNITSELYNKLNCKGIVRFDYILNDDKLYFLEVNSIPGLTEESILPKQVKAMGISLKQLYTILIEDTLYKD